MYAMVPTAIPGLVRRFVESPMVSPSALSSAFLQEFRQSEIQNLGGAAFGHKNVPRLDVAVHDSFFVCRIQRVRQLDADFDRAGDGQASPPPAVCPAACPSSSSIAMNVRPSCSSIAWMVQIPG